MEAKIFILCMEFDMLPASTIAKRLGIPRTTVYNHINSLLQQQFLVTHTDSKGMMYSAIDPDMLILLLKKRTKQTQSLIQEIEDIKPTLYAQHQTSSMTPKIKYYQGQEAVDLIYDSYQKSIWWFAYFDPKIAMDALGYTVEKLAKTFSKVRGSIREILVNNKEWKAYKSLISNPKHKIKLLTLGTEQSIPTDTICFDGVMYYVSYGKSMMVLEVNHPAMYQTHKTIFDQLRAKL